MKALILCGGLGTRLRSVVSDVPKPMALINKKPFLEYLLLWLKRNGINDVILLSGYKANKIRDYFGNSFNGINIEYSVEPEPLGTAGALKYASKTYKLNNDFILINGDTFFDVELNSFIDFHKSNSNCLATVSLRLLNDLSRYGLVFIDDSYRITDFLEKNEQAKNGLINAGIYILNKKILQFIPEGKKCSLEKEVFPELVKNNVIYGYIDAGNFIDIGIPDDYEKANQLLPLWELQKKVPAVFLDRDGVIIEDSGYVHSKEELRFLPGAIEALRKINDSNRLCIVVSNQAGVAHGLYSEDDVIVFENYIEKKLKEYNVRIDDFYYCPYHNNAEVKAYRQDSFYRKPNPGMILLAANKHNISLSNSFMIGDQMSDIIKLPQLKTYIIKSQYVNKWDFNSLNEAIDKLLMNKNG